MTAVAILTRFYPRSYSSGGIQRLLDAVAAAIVDELGKAGA